MKNQILLILLCTCYIGQSQINERQVYKAERANESGQYYALIDSFLSFDCALDVFPKFYPIWPPSDSSEVNASFESGTWQCRKLDTEQFIDQPQFVDVTAFSALDSILISPIRLTQPVSWIWTDFEVFLLREVREESAPQRIYSFCDKNDFCIESLQMNDGITTRLHAKKDVQISFNLFPLQASHQRIAHSLLSVPIHFHKGYYEWSHFFKNLPYSTYILEIISANQKHVCRIETHGQRPKLCTSIGQYKRIYRTYL